jgi:hypothetical protein
MLVPVTDPTPRVALVLGQLLPLLVSLVGLCAMPSASAQGTFARLPPSA